MFDEENNNGEESKQFDEREHFDAKASEVAKEEGMYAAAVSRAGILQAAQELAVQLAQRYGEVTIDDVQAVLIQWGHHPGELGMAAGSVFRGSLWTAIGYKKTTRTSSHARPVTVWRLREG